MEQLKLPMLTVYSGPSLVDPSLVRSCKTFRDAVRLCWLSRTRVSLTQSGLAAEAGLYASHVAEYLSPYPSKRELPSRYINDFELACGNRLVTQWLAAQAELTILEQFIPQARAAGGAS